MKQEAFRSSEEERIEEERIYDDVTHLDSIEEKERIWLRERSNEYYGTKLGSVALDHGEGECAFLLASQLTVEEWRQAS